MLITTTVKNITKIPVCQRIYTLILQQFFNNFYLILKANNSRLNKLN